MIIMDYLQFLDARKKSYETKIIRPQNLMVLERFR